MRGLKYQKFKKQSTDALVAPLAGAWIEIITKYSISSAFRVVAPLAGAWIEIQHRLYDLKNPEVAPLAGAWIEICARTPVFCPRPLSHPSRVRGLKYKRSVRL